MILDEKEEKKKTEKNSQKTCTAHLSTPDALKTVESPKSVTLMFPEYGRGKDNERSTSKNVPIQRPDIGAMKKEKKKV